MPVDVPVTAINYKWCFTYSWFVGDLVCWTYLLIIVCFFPPQQPNSMILFLLSFLPPPLLPIEVCYVTVAAERSTQPG